MGWIGAAKDYTKAEYYLTTTKAQRAEYAKIKADLKLDRGPLDPFIEKASKKADNGNGFSWWKPWHWLKKYVAKRGNHYKNIRYQGGLHWAEDIDEAGNIIFRGFHYDAIDALSLGGLGFIFHGLLEVYPDQLGYGNFLRAIQPISSTLYNNRYLYMHY